MINARSAGLKNLVNIPYYITRKKTEFVFLIPIFLHSFLQNRIAINI